MPEGDAKKILALDGGGIRGLISVEVLCRIETLLREQTQTPDLLLCDYFDLIAGTSTGAITAALLATGHSAADVRRFYEEEALELFRPASLLNRLHYRYNATQLARRLREVFGADTTLGSGALRTLVMFVLQNATTDSPWFLTNNPKARFNDRALDNCNLDLPLWQLVRASTAAPTLFAPEVIRVGDETFLFNDGALTNYDNPAFKAFLMTTFEPYGLAWPTGTDKILVVSVGTGLGSLANSALVPRAMHLAYNARMLPFALLGSGRFQQDLLCRVFGNCLVGDPLDAELGDLIGVSGPGGTKLFTYLRYNVPLTQAGLASIGCEHLKAKCLDRLDDVTQLGNLRHVGAALGDARVRGEHFRGFLA